MIDGSFYQLFFSYYFLFSNATLVPLAISCLVQLSSVRRSLLNTNERLSVLNLITYGKRAIGHNYWKRYSSFLINRDVRDLVFYST
jgi:exportin-7